ncbi:hypothetical protein [Lysinibacillus xylanilyticus]|uniref:hypothetical protein n=1 Tax=Lysinibacillus xylanilyticus TaxID=582475 RepID=UPI00083CA213|nr:hypothetical protein [Lysinibacillus xylanilyticus]
MKLLQLWIFYPIILGINSILIFYFINSNLIPLGLIFLTISIFLPAIIYFFMVRETPRGNEPIIIAGIMAAISSLYFYLLNNHIIKKESINNISNFLSFYNNENLEISFSMTGAKPVLSLWFITFLSILVVHKIKQFILGKKVNYG